MKTLYFKVILHYITLLNTAWMFAFILQVLITSCVSPDPITDLTPEERDLYITNRDKSVNFSDYQTYFIKDSVKLITKEFGSTEETVNASPLILSTIKSELDKIGFVQVNNPDDADVGVVASVLKFSELLPTTYFPYVGGAGYFGYVSPGFWGFPGYSYAYPGYYGYYQIEVGSISIEMYDLKTARQPGQSSLNIIWSALLAGSLAGTTDENNGERIVEAISGAFLQSPYLKDGK